MEHHGHHDPGVVDPTSPGAHSPGDWGVIAQRMGTWRLLGYLAVGCLVVLPCMLMPAAWERGAWLLVGLVAWANAGKWLMASKARADARAANSADEPR